MFFTVLNNHFADFCFNQLARKTRLPVFTSYIPILPSSVLAVDVLGMPHPCQIHAHHHDVKTSNKPSHENQHLLHFSDITASMVCANKNSREH